MFWVLAATGGEAGFDLFKILQGSPLISKTVLGLLVFSSVLSVAIIVERAMVLKRARKSTEQAVELLNIWAAQQSWDTARREISLATRQQMPLFSILRAGVSYWQELTSFGETRVEVMEGMVQEAVTRELKLVRAMLRTNLQWLANIASVAPFIGLFGTVIGIIMTFAAIASKGNMGQEVVGSGIADALVATAMGLFAAIPALLGYNYYVDKIAQMILELEEIAQERIYFLVNRTDAAPAEAQLVGVGVTEE